MKLQIAFHANQLSERGCEVALYDYCHYSDVLLGHQPFVFYPRQAEANDASVVARFGSRFPLFAYDDYSEVDDEITRLGLNLFYGIKGGEVDHLVSRHVPTMVHAVFSQSPLEIHGAAYAFISEWLSLKSSAGFVPAVPFVVSSPDYVGPLDLRKKLEIPANAVVFGSYGGTRSFNVNFVRELVIPSVLDQRRDCYFLFMNYEPFIEHPRAIFLERSTDRISKQAFVRASDAMLHARRQGESFGLACAEFSVQSKPIFTYQYTPDRHHHYVLGPAAMLYRNAVHLEELLLSFDPSRLPSHDFAAYRRYTPDMVMEAFDRHLIRPAVARGAWAVGFTTATLPLRRPLSPLARGLFWHLQIMVRRLGRLARWLKRPFQV
ncbi:hypothetical protein [Vulcanococcus sp.]|uniref:hypothetical protein n=1 Tax=Vulcanococcus sp. TaxID=2856995 RepID=UPI0037DA3C54